jgi:5-methylcytosine-specific restriction protein A
VDHIKPLAEGGTDDRANKQGICKPCHRKKTAGESAAGRQNSRSQD